MSNTTTYPKLETTHLEELMRERRATAHFQPAEVPAEDITRALEMAREAPSGYNAQPWRFLIIRNAANRLALRKAAFEQAKIGEASVMVVAFGLREGWKEPFPRILEERARRLGLDGGSVDKQAKSATDFISTKDPAVWLNRHVMIGFTYLMLAFEELGWDTAPMEGFDAEAVKQTFSLPDDAEVVALLAVGRAAKSDQPHPGRVAVSAIAYDEFMGTPWRDSQG